MQESSSLRRGAKRYHGFVASVRILAFEAILAFDMSDAKFAGDPMKDLIQVQVIQNPIITRFFIG